MPTGDRRATPARGERVPGESELRRHAEERLEGAEAATSDDLGVADFDAVVHELRVHQIELEMQNEELRRAELGLDAQREKYFHLFDLAPVGYLTLTGAGIVGDANLTAVRMLRVERQLLYGQPFSAFVLSEDRDVYYLHLRALEKSDEPQTCELRLQRVCRETDAGAGPDYFWAKLESRPQRTADGETLSTWVTFSDISERRRALEAVHESEDKFKFFFDCSVVPHSITRVDGEIQVNDAFCKMLGYRPDELSGATWAQVSHPDDVAETQRHLDDLLSGERLAAHFEKRYVHKDGGTVWADVHTSLRRDDLGQPMYFMTTVIDMTDRRDAEDAARASARRHKTIIQTAMSGYCMVSAEGRLLEVNQAYCDISGYSEEELLTMSISELEVAETSSEVAEHIGRVVSLGKDRFESQQRRKDGSVYDVEVSAQFVDTDGGWLAAFTRDITELKRTHEYQRASREILTILSEPGDLSDAITDIITVLKETTGFDAVGIRLQVGEDFPYFAQRGFAEDFLLTENTLVAHDANGNACRDEAGNIELECTCGLVISGKTDPESSYFTHGGSFWTDDSLPLLDLPPDQDLRLRPRNECMMRGYASLALVPIRDRERVVGLVHLADRRRGMLTREVIELLEGIVSHIGEALMRKQAEHSIRESEERYRSILAATPDNVTITDLSGRITMASPAALRMFKLSSDADILGRMFTDCLVHEDRERAAASIARLSTAERLGDRLGEYRAVRSDGSTFDMEINTEFIRDGDGQPAGMVFIGRDISERKDAERQLESGAVQLEELLEERELNLAQLAASLSSIIEVVSQVVETRDPYTAGHERRVAELSVRIAQGMGMTSEQVEEVRIAALLHDVGKVSVPSEILVKPGKLSPMEFELIKDHSAAGARILASVDLEGPTAEIVLQHHERCDGSGYPRGLTADQLLEASKVIMVADVVEAMSSHRPYRPALGMGPALAEIDRGAGLQYDLGVAEACKRVMDSGFEFSEA